MSNPEPYWVNTNIDGQLGIVRKYYPKFCAPYTHEILEKTKHAWTLSACECTDGKFYVFNRHEYSKISPEEFKKERLGPYPSLDVALFAAATLERRSI